MEEYRIECIQQEMIGVIRDDQWRNKGQGRRDHVDMDILKTVRTGVGMGRHGRDDNNITLPVIQTAVALPVIQTAVVEKEGA